ncbi:MAG: PP2C family protein-serine/threonine phosphatase [Vulcanimicrobiaceae bacterium]
MEIAVGVERSQWRGERSDAHLIEALGPGAMLFAVADGFGGSAKGVPSADSALGTLRDYLRRRRRLGAFARSASSAGLRSILLSALEHTNARLFSLGGSHDDFVGSGASLTALLVVGGHAFVAHVGDARAYLVRLGSAEMLTADDAIPVAEPAGGTAAPSSLVAMPRMRSLLWRSLGTQRKLEASIGHVELRSGDCLALCTDGVHRCFEDGELAALLPSDAAVSAADRVARILGIVRARGGLDDGTLLVARDIDGAPAENGSVATSRRARSRIAFLLLLLMLASFGAYALRIDDFNHHPAPLSARVEPR